MIPKIVEFITSIHLKANWALVGVDIHDFLFDNDLSEMIVWYLIDFDSSCDTYKIVYT